MAVAGPVLVTLRSAPVVAEDTPMFTVAVLLAALVSLVVVPTVTVSVIIVPTVVVAATV